MAKRIETLSQSPCYQCGYDRKCEAMVKKTPQYKCIVEHMFGNADEDYNDCGLYIAIDWQERIKYGKKK